MPRIGGQAIKRNKPRTRAQRRRRREGIQRAALRIDVRKVKDGTEKVFVSMTVEEAQGLYWSLHGVGYDPMPAETLMTRLTDALAAAGKIGGEAEART